MVETEGVHAAGFAESDFRKQLEAQTPLGRIGQPNDVAPAAVFLASADAAWITAETLLIAGGFARILVDSLLAFRRCWERETPSNLEFFATDR
jgi:NAD(P)-dependent dehydrogenase (short-subunit alcohol dehydrogenase family)